MVGQYGWYQFYGLLAILINTPSIVVAGYDVEDQMCVENFQDYTTLRAYYLSWSFANSLLPMCINGYLYKRIILCLHKPGLVQCSSPKSASESRNKVTKMLISVSAIFIMCWTPPAVLCVLSPMIPGGYGTVNYVSTACALLNSSLNPLVYTLHSQQFRKSLVSLVFCRDSKELATHKIRQTNFSRIKTSSNYL